MMSGEVEFNEVFFTDARCPKDNVVGEVNGGWAVAMTLLGYERGEAAATFPLMFRTELDRLIALAKERGADRGPADPPAPGVVPHQGRDHAVPRHALAHRVPRRPPPRARGRHVQALLERVPPGRHRAGGRHPRRRTPWCPSGRWPASSFQTDDPGAPNDSASWVGTFFNARAGTIYAGLEPDPAQHPRRDGARPAQGARGRRPSTWREQQAGRS